MKRIALALFATAAAALATTSARADTHFRVGVNIGAPDYRAAPPAVVYAPPPSVVYAPPTVVVAPRGYWKDVSVKTWVPERMVMGRDRWGRPVRYSEPGYYTYRTDRVWVDGSADRGYRGRDNDDRRGYNYDNDNRGRDYRGGWNR